MHQSFEVSFYLDIFTGQNSTELIFYQVVRIPETSDESYKALLDFGRALGKTVVEAKVSFN